ncbi:MAG: polysulfide reductase NrfD [Cyanobacteria bacterium NC_groundwater_1444_Ag_S-0.65um_54_12]|nr:polysulfide reductase NrfD [Cyanobacteria bacterium NC_groundwater_1444_Ag_S-0.65um_54_12]
METTSNSAIKTLFWVSGVILLILGLCGWVDRLTAGHLHANYGQVVPWGLWVAGYIYCIGLSAGAFLISSLVYVFGVKRFEAIGRLSVFTALVTLIMALLFIWPDIGHMWRASNVMLFPNFKSPMAWMIWLYSAYFVLLLFEMYFLLRHDLVKGAREPGLRGSIYSFFSLGSNDLSETAWALDRKRVKLLGTIGVPLAIMFHGGVGTLFGVVMARPLWNTGLFPLMFLLGALLSGGGLLAIVAAIFQEGMSKYRDTMVSLGKLVLGMLAIYALFEIAEFMVALRSGIPGHVKPFELIFSGPYWQVFWFWQVGLGMVAPALLLFAFRDEPGMVAFAGLLVAAGFAGTRLNIVIPGQAAELLPGLDSALYSLRMNSMYAPSATEWLLAAGVIGLGLVLFGIGEMYLPKYKPTAETAEPALRGV